MDDRTIGMVYPFSVDPLYLVKTQIPRVDLVQYPFNLFLFGDNRSCVFQCADFGWRTFYFYRKMDGKDMRGKYEKVNHRRKYWWIVAGILLLLIAVLLVHHFTTQEQGKTILIPDFAPDNMDENIEKIPNDASAKDNSSNGASVRLIYSDEVTIDLRNETASLYFGNPTRSNQDIILQIIIQEEVIAQSDLIPAGYQLKTMNLLTDATSILQTGTYQGKFKIYYYDQETDELATINTEIPITITVE